MSARHLGPAIIERVPRWSPTGHLGARPHRFTLPYSTPRTSPKGIDMPAQRAPISPSSRNHRNATTRRPASIISVIFKSP